MKRIVFFLLTLATLSSCSKQSLDPNKDERLKEVSPKTANETTCLDGHIYWDADPSTDGTGWHLSTTGVGQNAYVFDNLPAEYEINGLPVTICMYKTEKRFASLSPDPVYKYHITSIKKR